MRTYEWQGEEQNDLYVTEEETETTMTNSDIIRLLILERYE